MKRLMLIGLALVFVQQPAQAQPSKHEPQKQPEPEVGGYRDGGNQEAPAESDRGVAVAPRCGPASGKDGQVCRGRGTRGSPELNTDPQLPRTTVVAEPHPDYVASGVGVGRVTRRILSGSHEVG